MDSDVFWDAQISRLLRGHRDPELPAARLDAMGRDLASRLAEDLVLEANLRALLPGYEDPELPSVRLAEMGKRLAGQLAGAGPRRLPRHRRARAERGPAWAWGVAAAAACVLILSAVLSTRPERLERPALGRTPATEETPSPAPEPPPPPIAPLPAPPAVRPPDLPVTPAPRPTRPEEPPAPAPAPPAPAPPPAPKPRETVVQAAPAEGPILERLEGSVSVVGDSGSRTPARTGARLETGHGMETAGKDAKAVLAFAEGTRVLVHADTAVRLPGPGLPLAVTRGSVAASVARQPAGQPFVLSTPHAEARVLGTKFTLAVSSEGTRLEVTEGRVRLTRTDGAAADVAAGQFAVAAKGTALFPRPLPEEPKTVFLEIEEFGTARGTKPAEGMVRRPFLEPFDSAAGGWCVSLPSSGMDVTGDVKLPKGTWHLWVRYRDEPGNSKITFNILLGDLLLGQGATPGRTRNFLWKRFSFAFPGGTARITLRSTFDGVKASPDAPDFRQSPYGALNRWDRICLTPDEAFTPE